MSDYTTISIAKELAEKIDEFIHESTFSSRKEYIVYLVRKDLEKRGYM